MLPVSRGSATSAFRPCSPGGVLVGGLRRHILSFADVPVAYNLLFAASRAGAWRLLLVGRRSAGGGLAQDEPLWPMAVGG